MQEIELNDISNELLIINQITIERLFKEDNQNALVLYLFYYKTAKWQQCNPIKASDEYCKKCLHWGEDKLRATKKNLKEMQLIETIKKTDEKGLVIGWYVKVNYLVDKSRTPKTTTPVIQEVDLPPNKILINNSINANNNINKKEDINKLISKKEYFDNEELNDLFNEFLKFRKKLKAINSDKAITLLINKLNEYNDETKMKMINQSIENSWKSVFPLKKEYKPKESGFDILRRQMKEIKEKERLENEQK